MDATTLSANFEAREKATAELRALTDEFAGREMPTEAREKETRLLAAVADYDDRVRRGVEAVRASETAQKLMAELKGIGSKSGGKADETANELRALGLGDGIDFRPDKALHKSGAELRAVVDTTTGKNVIPRTLYNRLLAEAVTRSTVMSGGATILSTSSGEPMDFTVVTGRASAGIVAENGTIPESNPTTVQRSMGAYKYAYASTLSSEFVADQALDLVAFLVNDAGPALGHGMGVHFLTGTGTNQPKGVLNAAPAATAAFAKTAKDTTVSDGLIDLFFELPQPYRGSAVYVVSDATAAKMRKLKDSQGQYLWQNALTAGQPPTFNGAPVLTDPAMPDDKVFFGDLSKYTIRLAGPLRVERSVDVKFQSDQIVYRFIQRADGLLVDERSAKVLTMTGP
ncbi:phage major capsid protein [Streptomyces sp. NRRL S-350]|uniref:phage major capsid protein n=1 Tax=Streptomyces sp. NRRL S-350 TaxID=1463902 RepID=UPI0004BF3D3F|nr:phage major capsid protein [Streptomyces sp. NRRL S-350]